ncbi:peptidase S51 [Agromyces sp. SYSU T00194]|uniref:peptidase S51 n=1 Tax=Agromyces chitinivorans TaxID=3158560 RepID=UPI0033998239
MSVHLVGGGWTPAHQPEVFRGFVAEAAERAAAEGAAVPVIAVLLLDVPGGGPNPYADLYRGALAAGGGADVRITGVAEADGEFAPVHLAGAHGVLVGGGPTPGYRRAVEPIAGELRRLVASGSPYLGFSAGAAIAADTAILGGWRIGGVPVCGEEAGEGLDDVTVEPGIGLVDLTVEVHAAQWGTLARLIAATEAGLVPGGVAIDEDTALVVGESVRVAGAGSVWRAEATDRGVLVTTLGA